MPNLEGIIDVIMPKKSPVYVIKWCVSLSRSTGSPLSLSLFISFSLSVYLSYLLPLHPFISVFTPYSSLHLSYSWTKTLFKSSPLPPYITASSPSVRSTSISSLSAERSCFSRSVMVHSVPPWNFFTSVRVLWRNGHLLTFIHHPFFFVASGKQRPLFSPHTVSSTCSFSRSTYPATPTGGSWGYQVCPLWGRHHVPWCVFHIYISRCFSIAL